jgi:hypothetical protein
MKYNGRSYARQKPRAPNASPAPTGSYQAQITKTTDGGSTFKTVFNVTNQFYVRTSLCCFVVACPHVNCRALAATVQRD